MFDNLLPDPACLFRFKIELHRLNTIDQVSDFQSWGLEDKHQLPPIGLKKEFSGSIKTKMGWNPQGLFFEFQLGSLRRPLDYLSAAIYTQIAINSRFNSTILRENEFCSTFNFSRNRPNNFDSPGKEVIPLERLHAYIYLKASRHPEAVEMSNTSVLGWVQAASTELTIWHHIGTSMIHGYRPEEFPDIGIDFDVALTTFDRNAMPHRWVMCHGSDSGKRNNPSLWTHCHLV